MLPTSRRPSQVQYTPTRSSPLRSSFASQSAASSKQVRFSISHDDSASSLSPKLGMEHFLPEPSHPRVKWRTAATATLLLFAAYVAWQAVLGPMNEVEKEEIGLGWKDYQAVSWGERTSVKGAEFGVEAAEESAYGDEDDESSSTTSRTPTSSKTSTTSLVLSQETSFPRMASSRVAKLLKDGSLSSYTWHASLQNWTTSESSTTSKWSTKGKSKTTWQTEDQGRLIVVGDVHGMNTSLATLLSRLSYNPTNDTLLFVGDLVAKSTTDSALSTLSLMRQLNALGVRGNHDQGVVEWRRWMESYGPLGGLTGISSSAEPTSTGSRAQQGKQGWMGDVEDEEVQMRSLRSVARKGARKVKRGWFGWGGGTTEEEQEEEAEAEAEEELEQELEEVPMLSSSASSASLSSTGARRPFGARPTIPSSSASPATTSPPSFFLPTATPSTNGSLTGPEWSWLDSNTRQLRSLGVTVPKGWEWGGEWFEIARHMSAEDARWMEALPLTLWIEELRTYIVHAGMLPWSSPSQELESLTNEVTSPRPSLLNSTSALSFTPSLPIRQILTSPERALLMVNQNRDPFTLLNMRTVKAGKKGGEKGDKKSEGGWSVSKGGKKGLPWMSVWESGMEECEKHKSCEKVGVIYGHWAAAGLEVKDNSIGLDSGCVYGRRLSALVLPKSYSNNLTSPLAAKLPGIGAFRHFDKNFTLSHDSTVDPYGSFAPKKVPSKPPSRGDLAKAKQVAAKARVPAEHRRVAGGMKKLSKRAPPPAGGLGGWLARPGVKGWSAEAEPASAAEEEPVEEDGDVEDAEPVEVDDEEGPEVEDEDEEGYEEMRVEFGGRAGWVVSRDCRADAEELGLEIK